MESATGRRFSSARETERSVVVGSMRKEVEPGGKNNLGSISLLKDLDKATIERLEEISDWYWYPEGELIFDRTDHGSEVYLIVEGSVRIVGHAKSGQEVAFVDLHAGQYFGELSAIDGEARSATLYALKESVLRDEGRAPQGLEAVALAHRG